MPCNVVICDGWVNPTDFLRCHLYPFVDFCDYPAMQVGRMTNLEFCIFLWSSLHNLELTSWLKRYHNVYDSSLWRTYRNVNVKYVYAGNDILYDTKYLNQNCRNSICIGSGGHGSLIFGENSEFAFSIIRRWLNDSIEPAHSGND